MIIEFTDNEYAVILDSLSIARKQINRPNIPTPNIDSALTKLGSFAKPSGCEFTIVTGEDRDNV